MIHSLHHTIKLNNNINIPIFGLGVFQLSNDDAKNAVKTAIKTGYRLIDTAQIYDNEEGTGLGIQEALAETKLSREDLFITSKVWNNHLSYEQTISAFENSLKKLKLTYLDLYLIHWPGNNAFLDSWKALEYLYNIGKIKAIGVSNFEQHHLETLFSSAKIIPAINQIELHPKLTQKSLRTFCNQHNITIQAWSPLMQGHLLTNPLILELAKKYKRSAAQIILRWHIQQNIPVVCRSTKANRIQSNANIFDFTLTNIDLEKISSLNENLRIGPDPDIFNF